MPFKPLNPESRKKIWINALRGTDIATTDLENFAANDMNGRQIKNVVKMARLLAKDENASLQASHIRDVLEVIEGDVPEH